MMQSNEKYQRPKDYPDWVDSVEDEILVAEALGINPFVRFVLNSKANCEAFLKSRRTANATSAQGKN